MNEIEVVSIRNGNTVYITAFDEGVQQLLTKDSEGPSATDATAYEITLLAGDAGELVYTTDVVDAPGKNIDINVKKPANNHTGAKRLPNVVKAHDPKE
jgi:hypothetical protein